MWNLSFLIYFHLGRIEAYSTAKQHLYLYTKAIQSDSI